MFLPLRLDYLCQYRDLYAQFIHMALVYENALRADDYEGVKKAVDKYLAIYRDIGRKFVAVHQAAYSILSQQQFDKYRQLASKLPYEEGALLSGTPFSPADMFTWHLTFAGEIKLTEIPQEISGKPHATFAFGSRI